MVRVQRNSPKERAWATAGNYDRFHHPRQLWQTSKLRARRPLPINPLNYLEHPYTKEAKMHVATAPEPLEYPLVGDVPLVAPNAWRTLPKTLEKPTNIPEIDVENIYAAAPAYRGIPAEHVRQLWPTLGLK